MATRAKFTRNKGYGDIKPTLGGRTETVKITDLVEMVEYPKKGGALQLRPIGPIESRGLHKIKVTKKDGTETEITKVCLAFDPSTDERDTTKKCPYCKMSPDQAKFSKAYFTNVIDRRLQEDEPSKLPKHTASESKTGFKDIDSKSWTPARVIRAPSTVSSRFKSLGEKNLVKAKDGTKKAYPVNHQKYGFDLDVGFDKTRPPATMYEVDRNNDARYTPLTEAELDLLVWNIEEIYPPEDYDTAKKEAEGLSSRFKGAKKSVVDDDDDDQDDDSMDDDEDEDDKPARGKKKPAAKASSKKKSSRDDDDDDDEDEDDEEEEDDDMDLDDEDEDDEPPKKKKPAAKSSAKKKSSRDDDEDEDEDDDIDDEDDEDGGALDDDDEDSDDDEDDSDDEDEDDEPPARKKKPAAKASVKKPAAKSSKKKVDDDEDEDDDLDDLDDDEDEEDSPPPKRKPAAKPAAKKKSSR